MAKHFPVEVFFGAVVVAACWAGLSRPSLQANATQPPIQPQRSASGVRSPEGTLTVYYKIKGADNVAHLDGVTAIDFYPGCIAIQYKQGVVQRGQVLFTDRTEDLHWLPAAEKK